MAHTAVQISTEKYGTVYTESIHRDTRLVVKKGAARVVYQHYCDCDAASAGTDPFPGVHETDSYAVGDEADATALAAVESAITALDSSDKVLAVLYRAFLDHISAQEVAKETSPLFEGTVVA